MVRPAPAFVHVRSAAPRVSVRVLGIDPGTLRLGYGVIECYGPAHVGVRYVECGVISAPARDPRHTPSLENVGDASGIPPRTSSPPYASTAK